MVETFQPTERLRPHVRAILVVDATGEQHWTSSHGDLARRALLSLVLAFSACGGTTSGTAGTGGAGSAGSAGSSGTAGSSGSSGSAGKGGSSGAGATSSGGSGGLDCSTVGCGAPPLCGDGCQAPCGCCACGLGQVQNIGGVDYVCQGDCWAPVAADGGAACGGDGGCPCTSDADCPSTRYCASSDDVCRDDGTCWDDLDCDLAGNTYAGPACVGYGECSAGTCSDQCGDSSCRDLAEVSFGFCEMELGWAIVNGACTLISGCDARGFTFFETLSECRTTCIR